MVKELCLHFFTSSAAINNFRCNLYWILLTLPKILIQNENENINASLLVTSLGPDFVILSLSHIAENPWGVFTESMLEHLIAVGALKHIWSWYSRGL